jgi:3-phosphoshikimate 1-carboxyvinyltransferase
MIEALRSLGTGFEKIGSRLIVKPGKLTGGVKIDCGLAGTVMRFLPPIAALALGPTTFDGDAAARKRPMNVTVTSLRDLGVDVADEGRGAPELVPEVGDRPGAVAGDASVTPPDDGGRGERQQAGDVGRGQAVLHEVV